MICELPEVVEAAVIGVAHEWMGEAIAAFVVTVGKAAPSSEAVVNHCRNRLPSFKLPHSVRFLPQLPHNSSGKVLKNELRKHLASDALKLQY